MADTNAEATSGDPGSNKPKPEGVLGTQGSLAERLAEALKSTMPQQKTAGSRAAPEPVILEEHIVEKAPVDVTAEDVGLKLPTPSPEISISLKPQPLMAMPPMKASIPPPKPVLTPKVEPPQKVLLSPIAIPPLSDEALAPSLVPPPKPIAQPQIPETKAPVTKPVISASSLETKPDTPDDGNLSTDIQKILSQVKLPERRDFKAAADKPPASAPSTPKDLGSMVMKPPADAETARAMTSKPEDAPVSSVHTLKDDLQHVVKDKKMSLVRAVSLEQDKKRNGVIEEEFGRSERHKRTAGILFATFLFFGMGLAALGGVYYVVMSHSASDVPSLNSLVFAEQSVALPLDNTTPSELKRRVAAARSTQSGSLGSITRIVPMIQGIDPNAQPTLATTQQFFTAMGFNAPTDLTNSLDSTFFFGLHVVDKNAPVLVIPVTNYDRAFASMLTWEATMNADLSPAFTPVPSTILDSNGIPSQRVFTDDVMRNYDVRELKDDSGNIVLYYSFPSKNLLIIAESPYSFPELLSRLQSVRRL